MKNQNSIIKYLAGALGALLVFIGKPAEADVNNDVDVSNDIGNETSYSIDNMGDNIMYDSCDPFTCPPKPE